MNRNRGGADVPTDTNWNLGHRDVGAPIGVFDSGLGGLTVVRQLRRVLPHEDLVYLGDTARVPYGTKSPATVTRYAMEAARFLEKQGVKAIVVACNTATAWGLPTLQSHLRIPLFGVVKPGVEAALAGSRHRRIGVIATTATIRSGAYQKALKGLGGRSVQVVAKACPLLVPLVEEGWQHHPVTEQVLREYLGEWKGLDLDTLVLGCTHYPLLKRAMRRVMGSKVRLVDSAAVCAKAVATGLRGAGLLSEDRRREGKLVAWVTDEEPRFSEVAAKLLHMRRIRAGVVTLKPWHPK